MNMVAKQLTAQSLILLLSASVSFAQIPPPPEGNPPPPPPDAAQPLFSQHELDQMLAPIALYPDALLPQILQPFVHVATQSTYPTSMRTAIVAARSTIN